MPDYEIAGERLRRKNFYAPCALGPRLDAARQDDLAEYVRLLKAASWADNITNREWPVVLDEDEATTTNRYRLKKKAAGWMMALARIAVLNPELLRSAADLAREMYADQVGETYPWADLAVPLANLPRPEPDEQVLLRIVPPRACD